MCIINEEAKVSDTNILVALDKAKKRQFIAYSNKMFTKEKNNAMILPYPNPESIILHDLSNYTKLFVDCESCFPMFKFTNSMSDDNDSMRSVSYLEVLNVGDYQVSVCKKVDDFDRVNPNVFSLNPHVKILLNKKYSKGFGFLVCKFKENKQYDFSPFGYSHDIASFGMFVPTRHFHDGTNEELYPRYDHAIYVINDNLNLKIDMSINNYKGMSTKTSKTNNIDYKKINFDFDDFISIRKIEIDSYYNNGDFIFPYEDKMKTAFSQLLY